MRKLDVSARVINPNKIAASPTEIERRLAYLQQRQAQYDNHNSRERALPSKQFDEGQFARQLDAVMYGNELTQRANHKVAMHEAMLKQKAQTRHFDWTKRVYEPIQTAVSTAVDANFAAVHTQRQRAQAEYLDVSGKRTIYLDDLVKNGDYDPYQVNKTASIRAKVKVLDPLKRVTDRKWEEDELMNRETYRRGRSKEILPPTRWTNEAMEATPWGHFERTDLAGGLTMAFAGKDNESSVRFMDYDQPPSMSWHDKTGTLRASEVDKEFPIGKKTGYIYTKQPTDHVVKHTNVTSHIYSPKDKHTDDGGSRLDHTIADVMRNAK